MIIFVLFVILIKTELNEKDKIQKPN